MHEVSDHPRSGKRSYLIFTIVVVLSLSSAISTVVVVSLLRTGTISLHRNGVLDMVLNASVYGLIFSFLVNIVLIYYYTIKRLWGRAILSFGLVIVVLIGMMFLGRID